MRKVPNPKNLLEFALGMKDDAKDDNIIRLPVQSIDGDGPVELRWTFRKQQRRPLSIVIRSAAIQCGRSVPGALIPNNPIERLADVPAEQLRAERRELRLDLEFHRGRAAQALDLLRFAEAPEVRAAANDAAREILLVRSSLRAIKAVFWLQAERASEPKPAA